MWLKRRNSHLQLKQLSREAFRHYEFLRESLRKGLRLRRKLQRCILMNTAGSWLVSSETTLLSAAPVLKGSCYVLGAHEVSSHIEKARQVCRQKLITICTPFIDQFGQYLHLGRSVIVFFSVFYIYSHNCTTGFGQKLSKNP